MTTTAEAAEGRALYREVRPEDVPEILTLLEQSFERGWPNIPLQVPPLEHLCWKMDSPQLIPGDASVIELDGRIIAYNGTVGRDVWVRGERVPGRSGVDLAVHPDFQGTGLVGPWREWRRARRPNPEPVGIGEGSTHPRLRRSSRRRNERRLIANRVDVLTLPLSMTAIARGSSGIGSPLTWARAGRTIAKSIGGRVRHRRLPEVARLPAVREVASFDESADELWERARESWDFAVVRDRRYLNWRYCDPRAGVYRVTAVGDDPRLDGFMVTALLGQDAQLVDVLTAPGDLNALRALVADAIEDARRRGAASLSVQMARHHPYREVLLRCGFVPTKWVRTMGFNERRSWALGFLADDARARLHVAFGDTDHI